MHLRCALPSSLNGNHNAQDTRGWSTWSWSTGGQGQVEDPPGGAHVEHLEHECNLQPSPRFTRCSQGVVMFEL